MGRIKSLAIKKAAKQFYGSAAGFNADFENNKKLLKDIIVYKSIRNKIAGAIVRLAKKEER